MNLYERTFALDDIVIRSGGDGRTVEAYAAVFDTPAEVRDQHGHYMEVIGRAAFNRTIANNANRVSVLYNHAMTEYGTPSELGSVPIGHPLEIRADNRGLRTVTRYNRSALADAVLEAIRNGDIRGQSFRGRIYRSSPERVPIVRAGQPLPTVTRHELGLTEYGPTRAPVYVGAEILAVRSQAEAIEQLLAAGATDDEIVQLVRTLTSATPYGDPAGEDTTATPNPGPGAEDPPPVGHSGRLEVRRARLRMEAMRLGVLTHGKAESR